MTEKLVKCCVDLAKESRYSYTEISQLAQISKLDCEKIVRIVKDSKLRTLEPIIGFIKIHNNKDV